MIPVQGFKSARAGGEPAGTNGGEGRDWQVALTCLCAIFLVLGVTLHGLETVPHAASTAAYLLAYLAGGWRAGRGAVSELLRGRINVDFLMVAAALGAGAVDRWQEGAILMFLFSLSGTLEAHAMRRTRRAIGALMKIRPREALARRDGIERRIPAGDLEIGDIVIVKPGEAISADGIVVLGETLVDQAAITGESIPVPRKPGDPVFAGTLNQKGAVEVRVTKAFADTTLSRIIRLVEEAQSQKALPQRFSDWFGRYYTAGVIAGSGLYMAILMLMERSWSDTFYSSMVLLVAASPCALVMATPSAILSAIANAARRGILMKGGAALEMLDRIRVVAIDKTGTLTAGRAQVTDVIPVPGITGDELLTLAASAESRADHPLADAVLAEARRRKLEIREPQVLEAISGLGIRAILNGRQVWVGTEAIIEGAGIEIRPAVRDRLRKLEAEGKSTMIVAAEGVAGIVGVADVVRPSARDAIDRLRAMGLRTVMLTGDNRDVAAAIATSLGMDEFRAGLLPDEKLRIVEELGRIHGDVAMVGDGVNDAPALATAAVGVAMGAAGTDVALETADIVLMSDDLRKLADAIHLGKRTVRVLKQNWTFALLVVSVLIALALFGTIPLPLAVVGHEGNTLIVVLNGLRLLLHDPSRG